MLVIQPKGTGAIIADQPAGTTAGGNKRGNGAVDLQMGRNNATQVASGLLSTIVGGYGNTASGDYSTAMGYQTIASGEFATAIGMQNTASGILSYASGYFNTAQSAAETVIGYYATTGTGNSAELIATDRLFVIGNGTNNTTRSNALTILKNANTTIGGSLIINANGTGTSLALPATRGTSGQVLTTDGSGGTSWTAPASGTVTGVTGTAPIVSSGGNTPAISISAATTSAAGSMSATDKTKLDGSTHAIGESYGGGIVFYVYDGGRHGLIAATEDQSTGIIWYNGTNTTTNAVRDGISAGMYNTERIIANQGAGSYAAQLCANYQGGGYGDWYLPSKPELNLLYAQKDAVGGFASSADYLSSSEYDNSIAWGQDFTDGLPWGYLKSEAHYVRAIRAF